MRNAMALSLLMVVGPTMWEKGLGQESQKPTEQKLPSPTFQVEVIDVSPILGIGLSKDRFPGAVRTLDRKEIEKRRATSLTELFNEKLGSVTVNDVTTNPFQQNLRFRGFTASPLVGIPQGISVYQNGVRINEPFGDVVQFDLVPDFAIDKIQVISGSNPVYGLNTLGGAVGLELKNGFTFEGVQALAYGGAWGRYHLTGEYGGKSGPWAGYLGMSRVEEDGWRDFSPSQVDRVFGDLAFRQNRLDVGLSLTYAASNLNGNGLAPIELLEADPQAVFTFPDKTTNRLSFLQMQLNHALTGQLSVQANAYHRNLDRRTLNGDEADFEICEEEAHPSEGPSHVLCEGGEGGAIVDLSTGTLVTQETAEGNGTFNRTITAGNSYGVSLQSTYEKALFGGENFLVVGLAWDSSGIDFASNTEIGSLTSERTVNPTGIFIGEYQQAPDDEFNTDLFSQNRSYGLYLNNTLSLSEKIHFTLAGRYNSTNIKILDNLGIDLNGNHHFRRLNPFIGLTGQLTSNWTAFAGYSESNRSPTVVELSCADPEESCRVPNAFIADPPLEQVVSRTLEVGMRTRRPVSVDGIILDWSVVGFRSLNSDDIIFVASPHLIGTGFFKNVEAIRRWGLEIDYEGSYGDLGWYASYSLVDATFQSPLLLPSDEEINEAANESGELQVESGDRLPGVPGHNAKLGLTYDVRPGWSVALDSILTSNQVFLGDEGNDQRKLSGYRIFNLRSAYQFHRQAEIFVMIKNLFNHDYATFGALAELEIDLLEAPQAEDPRFLGPGAPRAAWGGLRIRF